MRIAVIGTGYVGLVTGVCFAEMGNYVWGVDIDEEKIAKLKQGKTPIYEPDLDTLLERNLKAGRLFFTTNLKEAIPQADVVFLALPTPPLPSGDADLSVVFKVAEEVAPLLNGYTVIVTKSTVPVGTTEKVKEIISALTDAPFDVASNPEFLREGRAVEDFMRPDRVVIGTDSERAEAILKFLYEPFVRQGNPIITMDIRSSELTKYAANTFLAMRISFINEVSWLCEAVGADVMKVRLGMGLDPRIGKHFLYPGVGYGGSCFPKDVKAFYRQAQKEGIEFLLTPAVDRVNAIQQERFAQKIIDYFGGDLQGKTLAFWGFAFKPETDDIREAPALKTLDKVLERGAVVRGWDPAALENVKKQVGNKIYYAENMYDALDGVDALVIHTEWAEFRRPDFEKMKELMRKKVIFDGRNLYDPNFMEKEGFTYFSIGRKPVIV
ncbi:MAG: UDP-glucose/GDP-mannose dehydrogenase family protein [Chlorobi bacterium]|nr:UDP-glucose/GDP-mannose dehydrogenase family protein [Chlorobiota bacterium]